MNDFYLTLPSNTSVQNSTGSFSVHLPTKLYLGGQWEVALSEIQYPYTWNNVHGSTINEWRDSQIDITFTNLVTISVYVPTGYYETIHDLIAGIEYAKHQASKDMKRLVKRAHREKGILSEQHAKRLKKDFQHIQEAFFVEFDDTLKRVKTKFLPNKVKSITLSERLQYMLGYDARHIQKAKSKAPFQPDLRGGFYSLYIYCSLVEPQIVGNVTVPLLRTVHIDGIHGNMVEKIFHTPHYVPVTTKEVDRIEIDIKDDNNTSVPFKFGKTVVKLHLRKKRAVL